MQNNEYNSLTQKLIQSGILSVNNEENKEEDINFFNAKNYDVKESNKNNTESKRKRINNYDLELLENVNEKAEAEKENSIQKIIYKIFPKLYEFKVAKDAIQKMDELGIDANILLNKTIPYGEGEMRYKNLVKFIKYANEIQNKLKKKAK